MGEDSFNGRGATQTEGVGEHVRIEVSRS
jgi:hypothetical protein